ncbi:hypothetical protein ACFXKW_04930 [Streptomyces sp. NPDC059193]|uniref:hypothetical protein n=1 Tax=Streptomyces sp. NPDC059193 TaxID=3346763 RepID=UPI00369813F7
MTVLPRTWPRPLAGTLIERPRTEDEAAGLLTRAREAYRAVSDPRGEHDALVSLSHVARLRGETRRAAELSAQAAEAYQPPPRPRRGRDAMRGTGARPDNDRP